MLGTVALASIATVGVDAAAVAAGLDRRYVEKLPSELASAGVLDHDPAAVAFVRRPEPATVIADDDSPYAMAGWLDMLSTAGHFVDAVAEAARTAEAFRRRLSRTGWSMPSTGRTRRAAHPADAPLAARDARHRRPAPGRRPGGRRLVRAGAAELTMAGRTRNGRGVPEVAGGRQRRWTGVRWPWHGRSARSTGRRPSAGSTPRRREKRAHGATN